MGKQKGQRLSHPHHQDHADHGSATGQQQGLYQQLPGKPDALRTERQADAELLLPRHGPGQQQAGDVRAHNEQHQNAHRHKDSQGLAQDSLCAEVALPERRQREVYSAIGLGIHCSQASTQRGHFRARLFQADARLQPHDSRGFIPGAPVV